MTGSELADIMERFLKQRPDISPTKAGVVIRNKRDALIDLRRIKQVKQATIDKILAFIADPPSECLYIPRENRRKPGPKGDINQRRAATMRRTISRRAAALLDGDKSVLSISGKANAALSAAAKTIRFQREAQARLDDPVEQALLKVRKRRIVFRASVYGGPHNRFYISGRGRETISEDELVQLARKVA